MESLYDKNYLKENIGVNYFAGNNLLIIEYKRFKDEYESNSLLIINPLDGIEKNDYSLIISFKTNHKEKEQLYKELFSNLIDLDLQNNTKNDIINFEKLLSFQNIYSLYEMINKFCVNKIIKKEILKILFYIYFYEKYLNTNDLNEYHNYYLINII